MRNVRFLILLASTFVGMLSYAVEVTFKVDMAQQTVPSEGVHIAGTFQGWDPGATIMSSGIRHDLYVYSFF